MRLYNIDELAEILFNIDIANIKVGDDENTLYIKTEDKVNLINTLNDFKIINVNISFHNKNSLKLTLS